MDEAAHHRFGPEHLESRQHGRNGAVSCLWSAGAGGREGEESADRGTGERRAFGGERRGTPENDLVDERTTVGVEQRQRRGKRRAAILDAIVLSGRFGVRRCLSAIVAAVKIVMRLG